MSHELQKQFDEASQLHFDVCFLSTNIDKSYSLISSAFNDFYNLATDVKQFDLSLKLSEANSIFQNLVFYLSMKEYLDSTDIRDYLTRWEYLYNNLKNDYRYNNQTLRENTRGSYDLVKSDYDQINEMLTTSISASKNKMIKLQKELM